MGKAIVQEELQALSDRQVGRLMPKLCLVCTDLCLPEVADQDTPSPCSTNNWPLSEECVCPQA